MTTAGGGCLCGRVRSAVDLPFRRASICRCSRCRKHSGSQGCVPRERFRLLAGEELIRVFRPHGAPRFDGAAFENYR